MRYNFKPKSEFEKLGVRVYSALVENFSQTFFVGGMIRDLLLHRPITDIDIATQAKPDDIIKLLLASGINIVDANKNFGNIIAKQGSQEIEITTLRKDLKSTGRYPQIKFINSPEQDSQRRDFTINSLYLSLKDSKILDFHKGLRDLNFKQIKFIGEPQTRIAEDPLRIIRAMRFALVLKFNLETKAKKTIKDNFILLNKLTKTKIKKEADKIKNKKQKNILKKVINSLKLLDKYFK